MKTCTQCGEPKGLDQFCVDRSKPDGHHPWCKKCRASKRKARYERHPESYKKLLEGNARWRKANHARQLELQRRHYQENKHVYTAKAARRRARLKDATPRWLTKKDHARINREYEIAALLTEATGYSWHVDHNIPLNGNNVSGLHVPENLRVVLGLLTYPKPTLINFISDRRDKRSGRVKS